MEKTNKAILKLMLAVVIALVTTGCGSSTPRKNHVNLGTFECGGFEVTVKGDVTTVDGWGSIPIRIKRLTDENESFHWVSNHRTRILIANYDVNEERGMTTTWVGLNHTVPPFDDCIVANRGADSRDLAIGQTLDRKIYFEPSGDLPHYKLQFQCDELVEVIFEYERSR